jgi:DNA modification methylase
LANRIINKEIEQVAIDLLKHHPRNANNGDVEAIKKSLAVNGWYGSVVANLSTKHILAGNHRVMAAKALGWETVPVQWVDVTPEEELRILVVDNRTTRIGQDDTTKITDILAELANTPIGLDGTGYGAADLDALIDELAGMTEPTELLTDPDEVPEDVETRCKPGDLWILGRHRLLCGDSTKADDVARLMDGSVADCIFTSPPYGVGLDYGDTYKDSIDNLRSMLPKLAKLWKTLICDGGFVVINFGDIVPASKILGEKSPCEYPMSIEYWNIFREQKWNLWSRRIWCKPNPKVNSMHCISSNRAAPDFEHIWTWNNNTPIMHRVDGEYRSCLGWVDTTKLDGVDIGKDTHGAGFSVGLALWMITIHSREKSIIHEPFCGTGTTIIAAEQLGRKCYGMEISPKYCDVVIQRWENATGQKAVLDEG